MAAGFSCRRRRHRSWWVCLLLAVVVRGDDDLVKSTIREDQDERGELVEEEARQIRTKASVHPLTDIPAPGDFAEARAHLVSHPDLKWRAGDEVTILCHFTHRLAKNVNVTGLMGSLNNPINFNYYMQNFSYDRESLSLAAKEDATFDYTFRLAPTLDPGEWRVAVTVYYSVGRMLFAETFFNETVTLSAPSSALSVLALVALLAAASAAFYFGKDYVGLKDLSLTDQSLAKAKPEVAAAALEKKKVEHQEQRAPDDDSWTAHLAPGAAQKRKVPGKKTSKGGGGGKRK